MVRAGNRRAEVDLTPRGRRRAHQGRARAHALRGGERLREGDRDRRPALARRRARSCSRRSGRSSARAGCSSTTRPTRGLADVGGLEILKDWLERRGAAFSEAARALRPARAEGPPAPRRAGLRQEPHREGGRRAVGAAAPPARHGPHLQRPGRLLRGEPAPRDPRRGERRAGGAVGRRDREGARPGAQSSGVTDGGVTARVFGDAPHLAAGEDRAGVRGRDREPDRGAAARAAAQGALRRDLLRRSARRGRAARDPRASTSRGAAATRRVRPRRARRRAPRASAAPSSSRRSSPALYDAFADRVELAQAHLEPRGRGVAAALDDAARGDRAAARVGARPHPARLRRRVRRPGRPPAGAPRVAPAGSAASSTSSARARPRAPPTPRSRSAAADRFAAVERPRNAAAPPPRATGAALERFEPAPPPGLELLETAAGDPAVHALHSLREGPRRLRDGVRRLRREPRHRRAARPSTSGSGRSARRRPRARPAPRRSAARSWSGPPRRRRGPGASMGEALAREVGDRERRRLDAELPGGIGGAPLGTGLRALAVLLRRALAALGGRSGAGWRSRRP